MFWVSIRIFSLGRKLVPFRKEHLWDIWEDLWGGLGDRFFQTGAKNFPSEKLFLF